MGCRTNDDQFWFPQNYVGRSLPEEAPKTENATAKSVNKKNKKSNSKKLKKKQPTIDWMLCEVMTQLEINNLMNRLDLSQEIITWWHTHKNQEEKRVIKEAASKLSDRELLALGLKKDGTRK